MRKLLLATAILLASIAPAQAEYFGLPNGRSALLSTAPDLSVEGGFASGDIGNGDYDHFGLRVNYRVTPGIIAFADIGKGDIGAFSGTPFGVGFFYQLQDLISNYDSSLKFSYHDGSFEFQNVDINYDAIALELLVSGREAFTDSGMTWYANVGFHRLSAGSSTDNELGFGGGVILPVPNGEAYFGLDIIDGTSFGLGYRYFIR